MRKVEPISGKAMLLTFGLLCCLVVLAVVSDASDVSNTFARTVTAQEFEEIRSRNSSLIDYVYLSPNADFPRTNTVRKITIHHMAADLTLENLGSSFAQRDRAASANYAIDSNGNVALYVEESNRAWTSSNPDNDQQAITIEVANDVIGGNWHVSDAAYGKLIKLCIDICMRNGIDSLKWTGDSTGTLTVHQMFSFTTQCPGAYLLSKMPEIARKVNDALGDVKLVALTFDDGPSLYTEWLLDGLKERGVVATFFMTGQNGVGGTCGIDNGHEELLERMWSEGHQLANHTYSHASLSKLSYEEIASEISQVEDSIFSITGGEFECFMRPPGGALTDDICELGNGRTVLWSVDTRDWELRDASLVTEAILSNVDSGSIILLHDIYQTSVDGALQAIDVLLDKGYEFVTVAELLRRTETDLGSQFAYRSATDHEIKYPAYVAPNAKLAIHSAATVQLVCDMEEGLTYFYTLDGTYPTMASYRYECPVTLQDDVPVTIIGVDKWGTRTPATVCSGVIGA